MLTDKHTSSESLMRVRVPYGQVLMGTHGPTCALVPCALCSGVNGWCLDDRVRCHAICVKCVLTRRSVCGCGSERVLVWQRTHLCFVIVIVPALR